MAKNFKVNDRRGIVVGQSVAAAKRETGMTLGGQASRALALGRSGSSPTSDGDAAEMRRSRARGRTASAMSKVGSYVGGAGSYPSGGSVTLATPRPHDPFFYWQQNNLPYDFTDPQQLMLLRQMCRHIYKAHSLMASAIDIYSKWPLTGMEFVCKDKELTEFYTDLFMDQLDYEEYLPSLLHEYWTVGEAFPLGSFNETLGVWENEELLNPDDVFVEKSPFIKDPNLYIRLPASLRQVLTTGQPPEQYHSLMRSYPELAAYTHENAKMPVSNILLKQMKFKGDNFSPRGLPIMYRALRPLMQEEMLNAAQDAIADRMYTPLVLAKIGASATDLGTDEPWVPTDSQIAAFEDSLDAAMAADFRILTTHFAVEMESVFGREAMPNFDQDFERLFEKQLQAFGMSKTMLSGAGNGETFAADAINRDVITQLLGGAQRMIRKHVKDRCMVVAEAQGHYDYEVRGGKRYPIMEEVLEVDEETGEQRIVEQPKLLVPELRLAVMNMHDDQQERDFLETLKADGVPISMKRRLVNIEIEFDEEVEQVHDEQVEMAIENQRVRRDTYMRLKQERLPIPADLLADFDPKPVNQPEPTPAADPTRVPQLGLDNAQDMSAIAPTTDDLMALPGEPLGIPAGPGGTVDPAADPAAAQGAGAAPPAAPDNVTPLPARNRMRPPESDSMRDRMPKPASKQMVYIDTVLDMDKIAAKMPQPQQLRDPITGEGLFYEGVFAPGGLPVPRMATPGGMVSGPRHIGMRRHAGITRETVIGYEPGEVVEESA